VSNRNFIFLLSILLYSSLSFGLNKQDSLKNILKTSSDDTIKVSTLKLLAEELNLYGNYNESLKIGLEIRRLASRLNYSKGAGYSFAITGQAYLKLNEYDSAKNDLKNALLLFSQVDSKPDMASAHLLMGQVYDYQTQYDLALNEYDHVLDLLLVYSDQRVKARVLNNIGNTYFNKGSYEIALEHYLKSVKTSESFIDKHNFCSPLNNIGVIYAWLSQYEEALHYFLLYYDVIKNTEAKQEKASVLLNIGEAYNKLKDYQEALHYLNSAISIQIGLNDRRGLSLSYSNVGDAYSALSKPKIAEDYYHRSIDFARKIKNNDVLINPLVGAGKLFIRINQLSKATEKIVEARAIACTIRSKWWQEQTFLLSSKLDSAKGNISGAYVWYKRYFFLHDSLFNEQKSRQVIQMRELYESKKKESEIKQLNEAKKFEELRRTSQRNVFIISLLLLVVIIATLVYWGWSKKKLSKILIRQKAAIKKVNSQLKLSMEKIEFQNKTLALKNETLEELHREKDGLVGIVAHDLRSPLNRISGLANLVSMCDESTDEQKMMLNIIQNVCNDGNNLIRDLLDINQYENSKQLDLRDLDIIQFVTDALKNYNQLAKAKGLTLHFEYDRDMRPQMITDRECLVRIFDNLLTNAIKFSPFNRNVFIQLVVREDKNLSLRIKDEGPGFHADDLPHLFKKFKKLSARPTGGEPSTGLGLSIVKLLTEDLGGEIFVKNASEGGAEVTLIFPLTIDNENRIHINALQMQ
jgi:signal transduction histidine kinase/Tfp pilus assembly protein PilF